MHLDEETFARKLQAAHAYREIGDDVDRILTQQGKQAIQTERLRPVSNGSVRDTSEAPYYEVHGEKQVAAGHYEQVLRYRDHVAPLAETLRRWVKRQS